VLSIFTNSLSVAKSVQVDLVRHFFLGKPIKQMLFTFFPDTFIGNIFVVQDIQANLVRHLNLSLLLSVLA
jgi:hypothetical protein